MKIRELETLKASLPACPGIQGKERYFNSAVLIPFVIREDECYVLFQKRATHIRQGGEVCFPGGEYDPAHDKNYEDTAVRETIEELGIHREQMTLVGRLDILVSPQGVIVAPFIGILDIENIHDLSIDTNEVEKVFLVPLHYFEHTEPEEYRIRVEIQPSYIDARGNEHILLPAQKLGLPERYHTSWGGKKHRVLVYKSPGETIWGITAEIMHDLIQKLKTVSKYE